MTTLIVPTHNQPKYLRQCLESIRVHTKDITLIVIDNDADHDSKAAIKEYADEVIVVPGRIPEEQSLYELWNRGVRRSKTAYVGILNDDIVVTDGWLTAMTDILAHHRDVWCVSPRYSAGPLPPNFPDHLPEQVYPARPLGFCFVFRKRVFKRPEVGPFDQEYQLWGGDSEFFLKLCLAKHPTVVAQDSYIHHWGSSTINTLVHLHHRLSPDVALYAKRWENKPSPYA